LDDQKIIWKFAWRWYCHCCGEGGGCSSSFIALKVKQHESKTTATQSKYKQNKIIHDLIRLTSIVYGIEV